MADFDERFLCQVPAGIIEAAEKVRRWMDEQNRGTEWQLAGVCSRQAIYAKDARIAELEAKMAAEKAGDLYSALRSMHWSDGKLAVVHAKDLPLGVQTYSGDRLDAEIAAMQKGGV